MPVPPAERLLVGQASCLPLMGNRQDACSTSREITCGAGILPASDGQQARCLFHQQRDCGAGILPEAE
ncbi:hypothetical protein Q5692_23450 [Microcoleus sp. C2C3]|uniref:hypothetical protein n=1 Tax=unclassified Microcoleus TaxID=2642155 RepID=UPI002FD1F6A7